MIAKMIKNIAPATAFNAAVGVALAVGLSQSNPITDHLKATVLDVYACEPCAEPAVMPVVQ